MPLPHQLVVSNKGGLVSVALTKPLSCAQQEDKDAYWVQPKFWLCSWEGHGADRLWGRARVLYVHSLGLKCSPATRQRDPTRKLSTVQGKEHLGERLSCSWDRRTSQEQDVQKVSLAIGRVVKPDNSLPAQDLQTNKNSSIMWWRCRLCLSGCGFAPAPKQSCTRSGSSSSLRFKLDASWGRWAQNSPHSSASASLYHRQGQGSCQERSLVCFVTTVQTSKFHFSSGISSDGVLGTAAAFSWSGDLANCSFLECIAMSSCACSYQQSQY